MNLSLPPLGKGMGGGGRRGSEGGGGGGGRRGSGGGGGGGGGEGVRRVWEEFVEWRESFMKIYGSVSKMLENEVFFYFGLELITVGDSQD